MKNYYPYPFFPEDVPIDISFMFEDEKPAGKHGFLKAKGRKFVFEDGTVGKFWGTNFNGAACFPDHDYAKVVARRLAKIGINIVRFHQLDAQWHTPNIFRFTKGKRVTDACLDKESMDRLDYLVYCLKNEGIYVYLDMLTYRRFRSDEGVENAHLLSDAAKPYSVFSRRLIELQKQYCKDLWTHENPYTGLKYCDDPVFVLTEITNECEIFHTFNLENGYDEPYQSEFNKYFNRWLSDKGINRRAEDICSLDQQDEDLINFKIDLQNKYYTEMIAYMRDIGVKIPIAGTNWLRNPYNYLTQLTCDFLDAHPYFYDWRWKENDKHFLNAGVTDRRFSFVGPCGFMTSIDKPTYISEWDAPWPNENRAESVLHAAAVGAFQGWSGFAIHTYAYSTQLHRMEVLGEEFAAPKLANVPYRRGVFTTWKDPAKFGLFYHAAIITRRGDVSEGKDTYGIDVPDLHKWDRDLASYYIEKHKFVTSVGRKDDLKDLPKRVKNTSFVSDTGELFRDFEKNLGIIDTKRTKCVYGMLCKNGRIDLDGVSVACETDFAVIAMSSLSDAPITSSDNILLTTVGRAENTDAKFADDLMLDIGKPPVVIENIKADIEIDTDQRGMDVWAVSAEGNYIGKVQSTYEDGKLKFTVGGETRSMYYLIVKA